MKTAIGISGILVLCIAANVLLKIGASQPAEDRFLFGIIGWHAIAGFAAWTGAAFLNAWVLQWLPLNVAQSMLSAQFIGIVLASYVLLGEPIDPMRWVGIVLIAAGIVVVGVTAK